MTIIWKIDFATEIWIWSRKLDSLMEELWLEYESTPRNKKIKVVPEDAQKKIKEYLWVD